MSNIVWSCGGGLQSAAIAVLIKEGAIPKPDFSGIADTGREVATTWKYLHEVLNPYLADAGVVVEIVPHSLACVDLYGRHGELLIPAFTENGRMGTFCSGEWKRDVMERWYRTKGVKKCEQYLGFSFDEPTRCTGKAHRPWCLPVYPLYDKRITAAGCRLLVEKAGLPIPSKSRCWNCPHQNDSEWREVKLSSEWQQATDLDREIREADEMGGVYLHYSRVSLDLVDFSSKEDVDEFAATPLFRGCHDAGCFT